jgi:dipeptidyl aminopeptidase/acylaminoacyl peptidase
MGIASLTVYCNRAFCSDQPTEIPAGSTSAAQSAAVAGLTKRPVTVADSIQMTRLGDPYYTNGGSSKGIVAKFSPDGKHFVVILKKGNLKANTNEYSLVLFHTAEVSQSPEPQVLVSLASSSNRPAINDVLWLGDNDTIMFLGERPGEQTQLYSLKVSSKELTKLTSSPTNLTSFVATASGEVMVHGSERPVSTFLNESVARKGLAVTDEWMTDLIRGSYGGPESDDHSLFIKRLGKDSETKIATQGRIDDDPPYGLSLSPDGAHLLIRTEAAHVSDTWSEYEDQFLKAYTLHPAPKGGRTGIPQYHLVDTVTGVSPVLIDTPFPTFGEEVAWSPDSKSVVVSNVYLPLDVDDPLERALRKTHTFLVEFKVPSRQFVKISGEDLRLLSWDPKTGYVACDVGRMDSLTGKTTPKAYFRKNGERWSKVSAPEQTAAPPLPDIVLEEGMNTPPRIVAIDTATSRKSVLMDLNPQFQNLVLARVEEIAWKGAHGIEVKGGLYWPPDYVAGKKYPLVVQTHDWEPDKFWMDGPWPTAFAAQALASKGFFVLQAPDPDWHTGETAKQAPTAMAVYESAIDYLDRRGLIDRNRVGITGFSRTFWYVTYTLTHSKRHFVAAAIADGVDGSYFQYMAFPETAPEYEQVFGGPPYGKSMSQWLKQSPAFLMDKIETPLRIQALGPMSVLTVWHWFSGLSRLGRPVEMIYIPEGTHILEKPWERMTSQQGNVDWFCFWLKGEEDPDPAKGEQYKGWRELRHFHEAGTARRK